MNHVETVKREGQRGAIMMLVMVLLICFVIIMGALIQLIARQSHATSDKTQEGQSFGLADAGVRYVLWLMNEQGLTPGELRRNPPGGLAHHVVRGHNDEILGFFEVEIMPEDPSASDDLKVRAYGFNPNMIQACQSVEADVVLSAAGGYQVKMWNHEPGFDCRDLIEIDRVLYPLRVPVADGEEVVIEAALTPADVTGPGLADGYIFEAPLESLGRKTQIDVESIDFPIKVTVKPYTSNMVTQVFSMMRAAAGSALSGGGRELPGPPSVTCAAGSGMPNGSACVKPNLSGINLYDGDYSVRVESRVPRNQLTCDAEKGECKYKLHLYTKL